MVKRMAFETSDNRKRRQPIARRKFTLAMVAVKTQSVDIPINGELLQYIIDAPTLTTDATYDFTVTNEDSEVVYDNTGMAETVSTKVLLSAAPIPMSGTLTFTIDFTTNDTVSFDVYLYYK